MSLDPIYDPGRSVVLVAAAGTGKTWRLVRRYLRIVSRFADPEEIVAVTFTRAAAAEMRARVFAALTQTRAPSPEDDPVLAELIEGCSLGERLGLTERVAAAPIGTLHSLCARLLAEFPELSGVPPDARPLEPAEQELELDAFVRGWIDAAIDELRHPAHERCAELLASHPVAFVRSELRAMLGDPHGANVLGGAADSAPLTGPATLGERWPDPAAVQAARLRFVATQWLDYLREMHGPVAVLFQACATLERPNERQRELQAKLVAVSRHFGLRFEQLDAPRLVRVAEDVRALTSTRASKKLGPQIGALLQQLINIHRVVSSRRERPILPDPKRTLEADQAGHAEHLSRWLELADFAQRDWVASLRRRGVLRYDDLERFAADLLADPRAQDQLRGRYRHLLVDEYQDVSPIQARILEALVELCSRADAPVRVFYVGDPKQSIYRFRGADPEVFQRAERTVDDGQAVVRLAENRRSSPSLGRFFAELFPPLFAGALPWANTAEFGRPFELARLRDVEDHARVPWDQDVTTVRAADRLPGLAVDSLLRMRPSGELPEDADPLTRETERVAAHVYGLLSGATLGGDDPPTIRARDVAILVPRWQLAERYREALDARGIRADLAGGRGLLALPEVRDLINLVRCFADERDALAAVAVLRGPCFGLSDLGLYVLGRWPGLDRRVQEADPDLPEFAELDELWEPWDDGDDDEDDGDSWPRTPPRPYRQVLRHGRLFPERALAALAKAGVLEPERRAALQAQLERDAASLEGGRDRFWALARHAGARSTAELLADLITEFRLEAHWLASPRGRRAVANAWRFVEHVRTLEPDGPDLQRLVSWLDAGAEPAPEGLISPHADAVTITTWHGSKGKEWPVVVVAGLGEFRPSPTRASWSAEPVPTLGSQTKLAVPRIRPPHQGFSARFDSLHPVCANLTTPLEAAEAKRLLYVAMTRARDRLVLSGEADRRTHVDFGDRAWLSLERGTSMDPLIGEPKPAYLCRRPLELLVAGLDIPAPHAGLGAVGSDTLLRPRAAAWSLSFLRVIEDADLRAGLERSLPAPPPAPEPPPPPPPKARKRSRKRKVDKRQLGLFASMGLDPEPPPPPKPRRGRVDVMRWRAGPSLASWRPSAGRSPWPVSELDWDMPLPARRPIVLEADPDPDPDTSEDPRELGELFHAAMERWDFQGDPPNAAALGELVGVHFGARSPKRRAQLARWLERTLALLLDTPLHAELCAARERGELFHELDVDAMIPSFDAERADNRVRGRIDLLWRDGEGAWCLLDYKVTSKVRSRAEMEELQWEYGPQLLLYRRALEGWVLRGEKVRLGRFGLWLAPAGKVMWLEE